MARDEVRKLDGKYFAIVSETWKTQKCSRDVTIYPENHKADGFVNKVSVLKGIDLVFANKEIVKKIFFNYIPNKDFEVIKDYINLINVDNVKIIKVEDL